MRLFEELKQFGLNHRTMQTVDGVNVVPGVFTAFRRGVALELGGFTVGMNGEDGDFTLRFSRLGYRTWMDTKIIVYEDVPPTYPEIREQRVRWCRAVHHNQARHGPYRAGVATPKVWFNQTQQFFKSTFAPARLLLPMYLLMTALFEGTQRSVILVFLGGFVVGEIGLHGPPGHVDGRVPAGSPPVVGPLVAPVARVLDGLRHRGVDQHAGPAPRPARDPAGGHLPGGHPLTWTQGSAGAPGGRGRNPRWPPGPR